MDPFKRNYHTDYDLADPLELTGTWEGIARRTYMRCERWDCTHSPNIVAPQRVIAAVVGMR